MKKIYFNALQKSDFSKNYLSSKWAIVFLLFMSIGFSARAQVSLTASAGVPAGGPFTTLKAAFDAINAGTHQGNIVINIAAPGTTETAMAVLNSSGTGAANYVSVLINPTANGVTVTSNLTTSTLKLNGADNVTIDGFFGGTRQLTFSNTNTGTSSTVIWLGSATALDPSTNNIIRNCIIKGTISTFACIMASSGVTVGTSAEAANSNNTYENNLINTCFNGITLIGPTSGIETGNIITNNTVGSTILAEKIRFKAVQVINQLNVSITNNNIFGVTSTATGVNQASGIDVRGLTVGGVIEKNKISDIKIASFWGCNGIQLQSSSANTNMLIANNFIWDIAAGGFGSADSPDDGGYGMCLATGGGYRIYSNSINLTTNQNTGISASFWLDNTIGNNLDIRNNIFSNQQTTNTRYAIYSNAPNTVFSTINYNDYYNLGTNLGFLGAAQAGIANWRTATGQDVNSLSINPSFFSATDLHLFFDSPLDGVAQSIPAVTRDIDDDVRNATTPDIGADEFTPPNCTSNLGGTAVASVASICASGSATLSSTGYSFGLGIAYQWQFFNGSVWVDIPGQTNAASGNTGTITTTTQFRLRVICSAGAPDFSNTVTVTVNNPTVTGTTPGSRCGVGTVNLAATGSNVKWYANASGGTSLASGSPFTTPVISSSTTFYVSASVSDPAVFGGKPTTNGANGSNPTGGLRFIVNSTIILNSVLMFPQNAGANTINLYPGNTTTGVPIFTATYSFAGANPSGETVPINWTIPPGTYTIYQGSNPANCWRDLGTALPANAYPYVLGSSSAIINESTLGTGFYYFFYNWNITPSCEGLRTPVLATVTAPPAINPTVSPATVCNGSSVNLNVTSANAGYTYVWTPGPLTGAAQTVTPPTGPNVYTVTATDASGGANNGCVAVGTVTANINPIPTALTVSPAVANVCANPVITTITSSGALLPNQTVFYEPFESDLSGSQFSLGGTGVTATQNSTYFSQGNSSMHLTYLDGAVGWIETTNDINLSPFQNPSLTFNHICALERSPWDFGYIQYSTDGGGTWTSFPTSGYSGTGITYNGVVSFTTGSYPDWNAQFTTVASTPGTPPATSLWKRETLDLTPYQSSTQFRIRFRLTADLSGIFSGWYIDSVGIKGTGRAPVTWSPITNLFSNAAATIPYVAGTPLSTVYTKPTASIIYTATASAGAGCNSTATANLTVTGSTSINMTASPSGPICQGTSVTFTAGPSPIGPFQSYTWRVNGTIVQTSGSIAAITNTYTTNTLNNGDVVTCTILVSGGCGSPPVGTITMTVNPVPSVNITGGTTICNGAPPTVLTANGTIASGTITGYEWFINGVSQGAAAPATTFNATLPGTYTVAAYSAAGCADTSANFVVTLPTYTITATAGPNGTITPSGTVTVNCGSNQTFTITPNGGYSILDVLVNGISQGPIGTYTFTNVTANGNTISATFFIAGCATPPSASAGANASFCANATYTLAGTVGGSATGGTWSGGTGTFSPNATTLNAVYTPSAAEITAGTVTLTLTSNNPNGAPCIPSTSQVTLTINEIPTVSITGALGFCPSGNTILTANATTNPVGPITYQWLYNPGNIALGTAITQSSTLGAGTYQVTATGNGCSNTASEVIVVFGVPTVSINGIPVICTNTPTDLAAIAVPGSGTIGVNGYQWFLGGVPQAGATTSINSTTLPGSYTVQVTNSNGCSTLSAPFVLTVDNTPLNGNYTIGSGPASCTNYESFASALNDLNTRTISGNVRFDVASDYIETAPFGGLALGSVALNATTAGRTISFLKAGSGANPLIIAYAGGTGSPSTNNADGIFSLRGIDNVTIDQIDLIDNNTTGFTTMEYGYGLFKLNAPGIDGAQNNTISNCNITLKRSNNISPGAGMFHGCTGILVINATATAVVTPLVGPQAPTSAAGTNSNNKFYGNIISNVNNGIGLSGFAAGSPFTLGDNNNDIGGSNASTGNQILNFGGGGTQQAAGVRALNQWGVNISFNTINNNNGAGVSHTGVLRGIYGEAGTSANATINNNNITVIGAGPTQAYYGIDNFIGSTAASNTVTINNNTLTGTLTGATTGSWTGILNNATASTLNMSGNTVQNATLAGTGAWLGMSNNVTCATVAINDNFLLNNNITSTGALTAILNNTTSTNLSMSGNTISGNTKTSPSVAPFNIFWLNASGASTTAAINDNRITGNVVNASTFALTVAMINQGTSNYTFDGNIINNNGVANVSGAVAMIVQGYRNASSASGEIITNNTVRNLYVTGPGASTGLHTVTGLNINTAAASAKTISDNIIDSLYTKSNFSATIFGILNATGSTVNIFRNRIQSLFPGQSATGGSVAAGIRIQSGTVVNVYNNMIGLDLSKAFAPAANGVITTVDGLKGIDLSGTGNTVNIYFNSIHLAGSGGTGFGSSGISLSNATPPTINLRNNIIDNRALFNGAGRTVAMRWFATAATLLPRYASTSNNNSFYAGVPSANNLLYVDNSGNAYQTLAAYKAAVTPRETFSITGTTAFLNPPFDLHLDPSNSCEKDATATPIVGYTTDFDSDTRNVLNPDMGADEFDPSGAGLPTWKGVNSDWTSVSNWCGSVPTASTNVVIPAGSAFYPIITTNTPVCGNIDIEAGASVTITGVGKLAINGSITNAGTFNVLDGTIELAGASAQTIPAGAFQNNDIKNLIINNASVNLAGTLDLFGKLSFIGSNRTFATAGNLIIKSTATGTGSVGDITNNGTNTGNTITGDVTVERFTTARRAWRLLSPPSQHNLQTIKEAWQENQAPNATTPAGFGIQITSDRPSWSTDGFDLFTTAGASVKTYNPATNQWDGIISTVNVVTPTVSNGRFVTGKAYMTFIRGDRTINTFPAAATTSVLREKGALVTNNFVFPDGIGAGQFAAIGNPYASAVDFAKLTKTNLQNFYYLWDPQLGTLGAYQTFTQVGPSYVATPGGGSYSGSNSFIESGAAFFVRSSGPAGTLTFTENSKVDGSNLVTRAAGPATYLRTNLYQVSNGNAVLFDGVLNQYDANFENSMDDMDALKLGNFGENLGIIAEGQTLAVESRAGISGYDTIQYRIGQLRTQNYQFEFLPENIDQYGVEAFLEDAFLQTRTPVSNTDTTRVNFTIINDAGSYAANRFRLVFRALAPVPVSFVDVRADKQGPDVKVTWKVEQELNMSRYEIEKSTDGRQFSFAGSVQAIGNGTLTTTYSWLDVQAVKGNNFYRVRSIGNTGETKISRVVKVNFAEEGPVFAVFPNPVKADRVLKLSMKNAPAGDYMVNIINDAGQTLMNKRLNHPGGDNLFTITLNKQMAHGTYLLELVDINNRKTTFKVIY